MAGDPLTTAVGAKVDHDDGDIGDGVYTYSLG